MVSFQRKKNYETIIRKCYLDLLKREPDEPGFNHYLKLMENGIIDEEKLLEIMKNSVEYQRMTAFEAAKIYDKKQPYVFKGSYDILYVIHPNSALDYIVVKNGIYDKWIITRLKEFISPTSIIFDIGANAGLLSLPFAKQYVPQGFVYAFEPNSEIVRQLQENIKINQLKNIIIAPIALQDNPMINEITFYKRHVIDNDGRRNYGLSTIQFNPLYNTGEEIVSASTIDRYVYDNNLTNVSLIKIDAEGANSRVLAGGDKTIDAFLPIIIYEYSIINDKLINFQDSLKSFELLKKKRYRQYRIINEETLMELEEYNAELPESNIVCFHESRIPYFVHKF